MGKEEGGRVLRVYTDGACSKNGTAAAVGSWAFAIFDEEDNVLAENAARLSGNVTNNRGEMLAAVEGCLAASTILDFSKIEIYSDSAYLVNACNDKWYIKWLSNGWRTSSKGEVKNIDLWEKLIPFFEDRKYSFIKVKGHSTNKYNNYVDRLAVKERS